MQVKFYDYIDESKLKFAVIIARHGNQWVFCKHRERMTYELPGGHREPDEDILTTAKRELFEETGALDFTIQQVCVYSVTGKNRVNQTGEETYGMLYYAEISRFSDTLQSEMECIKLFDELPAAWTYPLIQPELIKEYLKRKPL